MSEPEGLCTACSSTQYCAEHEPAPVGQDATDRLTRDEKIVEAVLTHALRGWRKHDAARVTIYLDSGEFVRFSPTDVERLLAVAQRSGAARPSDGLSCPFCGDDDFDAVGLKIHLAGCESFSGLQVGNRVY